MIMTANVASSLQRMNELNKVKVACWGHAEFLRAIAVIDTRVGELSSKPRNLAFLFSGVFLNQVSGDVGRSILVQV